jgi:hypothetical protein
VVEHGQQAVQHVCSVRVLPAVGPGGFLAVPGRFQYRQDGGVLPDPAQADFAGEPPVDGQTALLLRRDPAAGAGQGLHQQRGGGRDGHAGAEERGQGCLPALPGRPVSALRIALVEGHGSHCAAGGRRMARTPDELDHARAEGAAMSREQAVGYALS